MKVENVKAEKERIERERDRRSELERLRLLDKKETLHVRSEFDAARNTRLVPKFQEKAVDKKFLQFEKIAENLKCPKKY